MYNQACSQPLPLPPAMPAPTCVEELRKEVATLGVNPLHHLGPGVNLVLSGTGNESGCRVRSRQYHRQAWVVDIASSGRWAGRQLHTSGLAGCCSDYPLAPPCP